MAVERAAAYADELAHSSLEMKAWSSASKGDSRASLSFLDIFSLHLRMMSMRLSCSSTACEWRQFLDYSMSCRMLVSLAVSCLKAQMSSCARTPGVRPQHELLEHVVSGAVSTAWSAKDNRSIDNVSTDGLVVAIIQLSLQLIKLYQSHYHIIFTTNYL